MSAIGSQPLSQNNYPLPAAPLLPYPLESGNFVYGHRLYTNDLLIRFCDTAVSKTNEPNKIMYFEVKTDSQYHMLIIKIQFGGFEKNETYDHSVNESFANYLEKKGIKVLDRKTNPRFHDLDHYFFNNSTEFKKMINLFINENHIDDYKDEITDRLFVVADILTKNT